MVSENPVEREIEELANRLYSGTAKDAFRHWAMACLVADQEPTDEDLQDHVDVDGSGDLGIDGYWVDEPNGRLLLLQTKYTAGRPGSLSRQVVQELRGAAASLLDQEYVRRHGNRRMREACADILETLLDDEYTLWLVVATNRRVARAAHDYASGQGSVPWLFEYEAASHRKDVVMDVLDSRDLALARDQLRATAVPGPRIELSVPQAMYHEIPGEFRAAQATVLARDVAEAYRLHRGAIFQLNVRGPLGSNRVNREIVTSLESPVFRNNFHLLNNGLNVVCDSFNYDRENGRLQIDNFQVVNGCQTTYTLYEYRDELDETVWLKLSISEGATWAAMIAKSTNTQNTVKPEDFRTLDQVHSVIRSKFESLEPPWLYEAKRGESRFATAFQQRREIARFGDRRLTMREVAQSALSFLGRPSMAKWELRALFDPQNGDGATLYDRIFGEDVGAEQLLLPTLLARAVKGRVRDILRQSTGASIPGRPTDPDWLPYARTHLVGLIAEWLRTVDARAGTEAEGLLPPTIARARLATLNDWFDEAFDVGVDAVRYWIDVSRMASGPLTNLREFFRSMDNYREMVDRLRHVSPRTRGE